MPLVQLADALLTDLAPRNPHERVRRAVAVARATTGEERRALLAELGRREPYCRHLAVTMAAATGESGHLLAALDDPYPAARRPCPTTPWPTSSWTRRGPTVSPSTPACAASGEPRWPIACCRWSGSGGATPRRPGS